MNKIYNLIATIGVALLMSSCCTVFKGSKESVHIVTNPPGATVEVNGIERGTTPIDLSLKKGFNGQTVVLKKQGYERRTIVPETSFDAVSIVNLLFWPGFIIDAATGAMMKYDPKAYELDLKKQTEEKTAAVK